MLAIWPSDLPQRFERRGYEQRLGDGRHRTNTTSGPGKMRRRSTAVSDPLTGTMELRGPQVLRFHAWVEETIGGGTLPFVFPDPLGGLPILVQIGDQMPGITNIAGDIFRLSLVLEKLRTGDFLPGVPELPSDRAWVMFGGAYVLSDRFPVYVEDAP